MGTNTRKIRSTKSITVTIKVDIKEGTHKADTEAVTHKVASMAAQALDHRTHKVVLVSAARASEEQTLKVALMF